jgi:hypothetical protein
MRTLRAIGIIDADSSWTGKYNIRSPVQFLASPEAQERALTDFLNDTERQLRAFGAFEFIGTTIDGRRGRFTVTRAGLIAAGHRQGAPATRDYLITLQENGFSSARAQLTWRGLRVETRLRIFAGASYD